ncbi:MAG: ABC transporter permease, partial [Anaerolineae bacterium]
SFQMKLRYYVAQRLLLILPILMGLSIITFVLSHIVPGDPIRLAAGPQATPEQIEAMTKEFGFDSPLVVEYLSYMRGLLRGNLGRSVVSHRPVAWDLRIYLPATVELTLAAMIIAVMAGVPLGVSAAISQNRWPDHYSRVLAILGGSVPSFWLGILLQLAFAFYFRLLPLGGRFDVIIPFPPKITGMLLVDSLLTHDLPRFGIALRHIILPAFCQSVGALALVSRLTRASVLDVIHRDFVLMERSCGVPEGIIFFKYVLKNSFMATLSMIGLFIGYMMAGSVLVETVFDWPGLGLYATNSAKFKDFQPVMGVTLLAGLIFCLVNLIVDLLYGVVDPRIRHG